MLTVLTFGANLDLDLTLIVMSVEQLTAFWEAVEGDTSLQEKLNASTDGEIDTPIEAAAVVSIAKEAGFIITAGDLLKAHAQAIMELNDEDLEKVAGGLTMCGHQFEDTKGQNFWQTCKGQLGIGNNAWPYSELEKTMLNKGFDGNVHGVNAY